MSQLAREGSDKWHLESQMQSSGFLRLASKASQRLPVAPGLQARVLVLSRVPSSSPASQGDPGAHHGNGGTASAQGHGRAVTVSQQRLSPPGLRQTPLAGTAWRLRGNYGWVVLWDAVAQGIAALLVLRHPWYIKAFVSSRQPWDILSLSG